MKERPIIMGAESVRAILEGRKTQTRRVIKPQPSVTYQWSGDAYEEGGMVKAVLSSKPTIHFDYMPKCRWQVGDRLWVRETWFHGDAWYDDNTSMSWKNTHRDGKCTWVDYKATNTEPDFDECWKSPMFMPRWASRITLEITDIRVERLQDITEEDALKEGFHNYGTDVDTLDAFCEAWQKLNAKRGYPWEKNPWVWVVTFKVVENGK